MAPPLVRDFALTQDATTFTRNTKRSRNDFLADQLHHDESERDVKKAARLLPIRTSSGTRSKSATTPLNATFLSGYTQMPTPVESSEDDLWDSKEVELDVSRLIEHDHSQAPRDSGVSSTRPQPGDEDYHMNLIGPQPLQFSSLSPPKTLRRRTTDMIPLEYNSAFANPLPAFAQDRTPTPIYQSFGRDADTAMAGSGRLPLLRTMLSPMLGDESPQTGQTGLPSPVTDDDLMEMSPIPQTDGMMGSLHLGNNPLDPAPPFQTSTNPTDAHRPTWQPRPSHGFEGQSDLNTNRTARLQMGYRADCEKCRQHVPGHYSHILWS